MSLLFDSQKASRQTCLAYIYQWLRITTNPKMKMGVFESHDVLFEVGNARYLALDADAVDVQPPLPHRPYSISLVTVIKCEGIASIGRDWIENYIRDADDLDDVFCPAFIEGLVFISSSSSSSSSSASTRTQVTQEAQAHLTALGNKWLQVASPQELPDRVDPGVYHLSGSKLRRVFRLYDDDNKTFLTTLKPVSRTSADQPFTQLHIAGSQYATLSAAVPSRLSSVHRQLRIGVKDLFRLHGLKTSLCNSSYYQISTPASETATVVQLLVDCGHHILGLTKLSSMIAREEPSDAVDFQTAFNPRGDGYQSPAGSSSGSAAAVASYDWIDCALGTDTSGSGRRPALVNGVFQFRPSHTAVPLEGMVPTFLQFDTPCIFARNLDVIDTVLSTWVPHTSPDAGDGPFEVIYPFDYWPVPSASHMALVDSLLDDMTNHLKASITRLSIQKLWESSPPEGASSDIEEYLQDVITHTYYYSYFHASDEFRDQYQEQFGHQPYAIPFVKQRWASGAAVSAEQHDSALLKLEVYRNWLLETVFFPHGDRTVMILPISSVEPHYRDEITKSPGNQVATDELFLSPILRSPDIVIPIGEIPYDSRITGKKEYLPVGVNFVGTPGSDFWLLGTMKALLEKSGRPKLVQTGSRIVSSAK